VDACGRTKNNNVSVQMKALIDRGNLLLHCQKLRGKYAAIVVTSGGSDPEKVEKEFEASMMKRSEEPGALQQKC
jgi:multimeric flavodoxin WrbA